MNYIVLMLSILFNACSGILLKYSSILESPNKYYVMFTGFISAAVSALLYTKALQTISIGTAATISAGLVILFSTIAGIFLFNEQVNIARISGAIMIFLGIFLLFK